MTSRLIKTSGSLRLSSSVIALEFSPCAVNLAVCCEDGIVIAVLNQESGIYAPNWIIQTSYLEEIEKIHWKSDSELTYMDKGGFSFNIIISPQQPFLNLLRKAGLEYLLVKNGCGDDDTGSGCYKLCPHLQISCQCTSGANPPSDPPSENRRYLKLSSQRCAVVKYGDETKLAVTRNCCDVCIYTLVTSKEIPLR
ncbi:hypothetical protein F5884DRAFT_813848 [Xylogone sp. PMI_703]|nr:hypothetical protein F5884DRAFT_813848 [Xylogone sp. PMI_703]